MIKKSFSYLSITILFIGICHTIHAIAIEDKYFVVVIPSYNNQQWYERNLASVMNQNYANFHVIYTDDCSPDGTGSLVEKYLEEHDSNHTVSLIKNNTRYGALYNLYRMINMCDDNTIIVTLDGDDWFPDNEVLTRLNNVYSSDEIWLTYGQFKLHPSATTGWASPMPDYIVENNSFRDFQHLPTHLRTFYAWLFKQIKLEDLLYIGQFYSMTWDMVMMFPMIEMAGERHRFISDIMYIYNNANSISDHHVSRQLQAHLAQVVKKKKRYIRLAEKPLSKKTSLEQKADVIIFSQTPEQLHILLKSLITYVEGINTISIIYKPSSDEEIESYNNIIQQYSEIEFYYIDKHRSNFQQTLLMLYRTTKSDYILFSKGDSCFQESVSLAECINDLETTSSYAFYFKLNAQDGALKYPHLPMVICKDHVVAWNFSLAQSKWSSANSLDLVLHKKRNSLEMALQQYYDLTPIGLELAWSNEGNLDRLGLCFEKTKVTSSLQ